MRGLKMINDIYVYDRKDFVGKLRKNIYIKDNIEYIKNDNKYLTINDFMKLNKVILSKNAMLSDNWNLRSCKQDCLLLDKICNVKTKRCKNPPKIKKVTYK